MLLPIADFSSLKVSFGSNSLSASPTETSDASAEQFKSALKAKMDAAMKDFKASIADVKTEAAEKAAEGRGKAADATDDSDSGDTTVRTDSKGVTVVKHHKSSSDDIPFLVFPITTVTLVFIYLIIRALMAPFTNRGRRSSPPVTVVGGLTDEEAVLMEKLQRTLAQMESRVESLETILIDNSRTKEKYGTKL